jgi:PEP-CTERM putative exosortase interaction domain
MLIRLIFATLILCASAVSHADLIDFEGYAPATQLGGYSISTSDFPLQHGDFYTYSPINNSSIWNETSFYVQNGIYPDSGSDWLATSSLGIELAGGGVFSLLSADIAETFYFRHPTNNILTYMLINAEDQFVQGVLDLDEIFGFETVQFGSVFSNIRQIIISADAAFAIDNIAVTRTVPAPSTIALLFLGIAGLICVRRRQKN